MQFGHYFDFVLDLLVGGAEHVTLVVQALLQHLNFTVFLFDFRLERLAMRPKVVHLFAKFGEHVHGRTSTVHRLQVIDLWQGEREVIIKMVGTWKCTHLVSHLVVFLLEQLQLFHPLLDVGGRLGQCVLQPRVVALQRLQLNLPLLGIGGAGRQRWRKLDDDRQQLKPRRCLPLSKCQLEPVVFVAQLRLDRGV